MSFKKEKTRNFFLDDTPIPNIFIKEYLADAPGDHVRVYLYAYMYAGLGHLLTNDDIASDLGLNIEDVLAAWTWFADRQIIRRVYPNTGDAAIFDVEFVDLKGSVFGRDSERAVNSGNRPTVLLGEKETQEMFRGIEAIIGSTMSATDIHKIGALIKGYSVPPEVILFAYRYCRERKLSTGASYVSEIVKDWIQRGIFTEEAARGFIGETDVRHSQYRSIMKALGLPYGNITDEEKKVFDLWLDDYGLTLDRILGIAKKSAGKRDKFSYVRKIIESDRDSLGGGAGGGQAPSGTGRVNRQKFYEERRNRSESEAGKRRAEVYGRIPEVKALDGQITALNLKLVSASISDDPGRGRYMERVNAEIEKCVARKSELMSRGGFKDDYMDVAYYCPLCKDTGVLDSGASCSCYHV